MPTDSPSCIWFAQYLAVVTFLKRKNGLIQHAEQAVFAYVTDVLDMFPLHEPESRTINCMQLSSFYDGTRYSHCTKSVRCLYHQSDDGVYLDWRPSAPCVMLYSSHHYYSTFWSASQYLVEIFQIKSSERAIFYYMIRIELHKISVRSEDVEVCYDFIAFKT